jgi:uncharacterized membrane protein
MPGMTNPTPVYVQFVRPPATNALAIAGLVLGIIACAIGFLFGLTVGAGSISLALMIPLAFVPSVLAIVFGFVGLNTAKKNGGLRRQAALWSVVLGFAPFLVYSITAVLLLSIFG